LSAVRLPVALERAIYETGHEDEESKKKGNKWKGSQIKGGGEGTKRETYALSSLPSSPSRTPVLFIFQSGFLPLPHHHPFSFTFSLS
jgi:hypothetical protein